MYRVACCVALALLMTTAGSLHAQDSHEIDRQNAPHSALPWLNLDSLSATRERPLFAPDRRKPVPPPPPVIVADHAANPAEVQQRQSQAAQRQQFELTGIITSNSETIVLLRDAVTSEYVTARSGDTVGRWRISVDSNEAVTLKDGAKEVRLEMFAER